MDPAWKNKKLGNDTITIGKFGCLLTCMAMVANSYGFKETPETLNDKMKAVGGFQGALVIPATMPNALPGIIYRNFIQCRNQPAPVVEIDAALNAGKPVIVEVDYSPAQGLQNHWVVLYERQGKDYLIRDPWPYPVETKGITLTSRYGFAGDPRDIIQGAVWIDSSGAAQPPKPKPAPKPVPATGFTVYAAADGLALRADPFVGDNLIKRVPLNAKLFVTEPKEAAQAKIGVVNQWLKLQDTDEGYEGYAAAWYVAAAPQSTPAPEPAAPAPPPPSQPGGLHLYAVIDALALRSQPIVSGTNLIKYLPLNSQLLALEPEAQARPKLGVEGQWLKVRDVGGTEGYSAAWYLSTSRKDDALGAYKKGDQPSPGPSAGLVVWPTTDGLALRSQPVISEATLVKRYSLNTDLLVMDPADQAEKKLGVINQWLKVKDLDGNQGYVAAWYVYKRP
jgi:hypothetical protein